MSDPNLVSEQRKVSIPLGIGILFLPLIFSWFTLRTGYSKISKIISFAWLGLSLLFVIASPKSPAPGNNNVATSQASNSKPAAAEATPAPPAPLPEISAVELNQLYKANEVSADDRFKGKTYIITGRVSGITKDAFDNIIVELSTGEMFAGVHCKMPDSMKAQVATLSKGTSLRLRGEIRGMIIGSVIVEAN